jgi:predicted DCC family thiol-disulfide oxidoreductase YuxK|tara:strand:- start:158 stop:532 length:375 start_codon:yes stop_codon:yes gene_type:complete
MTTRVLFNEDCPICNAEICHYIKYAESNGIELYFDKLGEADLSLYGVSKDQGAKRLHVISDGKVIDGLQAFQKLWAQMPRYKFLAVITNFPVIREIAGLVYDKILAPILYKTHLNRLKRNSDQS